MIKVWLAGAVVLLASCAPASSSAPGGGTITVSPQNSAFLIGNGRISVALTNGRTPILNAVASVDIPEKSGTETVPLIFVGHAYAQVPVYLGIASFDHTGDTVITVHAKLSGGGTNSGIAHINVTNKSAELPVGYAVPAISQPVAATVNGDLSKIDTGVPGPDNWHTETIAQGLAQHQPMVLFSALRDVVSAEYAARHYRSLSSYMPL